MDKMNDIIKELIYINSMLPDYNDAGHKSQPDNLRCDVGFAKDMLTRLITDFYSDIKKTQDERVAFGQRK